MAKKSILFLLVLLLLVSLGACRRQAEEATPTAAPQAATRAATATATSRPPTATATRPRPTATAEPESEPLLLDPARIDWAPRVVQSSPHAGEEALLDGAITVRFDQPMDRESVESAFAITAADEEVVEGDFEWPQPEVLVFTPDSRLARSQNYRVRISEQAASRGGRTLQEPVELQFETVGALEISQAIPAPETDGIDTDASITVIFNRPVVPLVTTGQQGQLPDPLELNPPVAGEGRWVSSSIYRFTPESPLAGATTYEATVPAGLEGILGSVLEAPYSWTFRTLQPSVATIVPATGSEEVEPTTSFTITFNMPMDRASVESAISLEPASPLSFSWDEEGRTVYVSHEGLLYLGSGYTLAVGAGAAAASGEATLDRPTSSSFNVVPYPAVARTSPDPEEEVPRYQYGIHVEFTAPMDPETIEGQIEIEPAPEEDPDYFVNGKHASVNFPLAAETTYEITVPATAADPYGNSLGEPYTFQFTTAPPPPVVSLNLPSPVSQISAGSPSVVDIVYRNVSTLEVALYDRGLPVGMLSEPYRINEFDPAGPPLESWSLPADAAENVAGQTALALADEGQSLPTGVYLLDATAPEITEEVGYWQNQRSLLIVADTNLVVKEMFGSVYVWATDLAGGEPAAGRTLTLYNANGAELGTTTTDDQGLARFDYQPPRDYLPGVLVVSGVPRAPGFGAASSNWNEGLGPWQFGVSATSGSERPEYAYIYTDRPIYRPGDTVHFRGILRDARYARYDLPERERVTAQVELFSFGGPDDGPIYQETLAVDGRGTFNGEVTLPEGADLGQYRLYLSPQGQIARAERAFTVADYRKPEFIVTVTPDTGERLRGEASQVTVEARYFFGAPATDLPVEWMVRQRDYRFPWDGAPFYSFDDDDNYFFEYGVDATFSGQMVLEGNGRTDENGRLEIMLPADLLAEIEGGSKLVTVEATIRDLSEFPVTASGEIVYHAAESYVGIAPADYLGEAGEETSVDLLTLDWEANPVPDQEVEVVFYEREYDYVRDTRFGLGSGRWEAVDNEVARSSVTTDEEGEAAATFVPESGGTYRAVATVTGAGGNSHTSSTLFWVSDSDYVAWRVNPEQKRMDLTPDRRTYEVGDTARVLVQTPFAGPVNAWLTIERGALIEQRLITLQSNSDVVEIPIAESFAPNAFVTIVAVKGAGAEDYADIRLGITELVVPPVRQELSISLEPRSDLLSPGESVTYDIRVTDYAGRPVEADLSLALVDLAVLTLQEDNAPPIVEAFYERQPYRSELGSGLFVRGEGLEVEIPREALGLGGGGGGGDEIAMAAARAVEDEEEGLRQEFPDTAFWRANLVTNADGEATVSIPLPDSLTTWRLSSKAVSAEGTLVGQTSVDVVATLPLLLRPVTPRFFTVGDVVYLGAVVNNNSGEALDVTVELEADGVSLDGPAQQTLSLPAGRQELVRWQVSVEDVEFADLTFRVEGGDYADATKPTFGVGPQQLIPVYRYDARDIAGSSGVLDDAGQQVEAILLPDTIDPREGSVDVQLSPSLAASLLETLDYVGEAESITTACAHGVINQLLPNLATARALQALAIEDAALEARLDGIVRAGIARLASLQKVSGGWGWCYSDSTDEYLTAYILYGLAQAAQAGYRLDGVDVNGALRSLPIRDATNLNEEWTANRQAWYLYVLAIWDAVEVADVDALFDEQRELLDPYARAYLALAYEAAGQADANSQALLSDLNNSAVLSAAGTHWESGTQGWRNLSSDIRSTAVVLKALVESDPENPLAPGAVRWLINARRAAHWPTPFETAWSVLALADWMAVTGELDANYEYAFAVNGTVQTSGTFSEENITDSQEVSVPLARLPQDEVNFLIFDREEGPGRLYYTAYLDAYLAAESVEPASRGFTVERVYYDAACDPAGERCEPLDDVEAGQRVRVELTVVTEADRTFVRVEDPLPAGAEAVDPGLATSATGLQGGVERVEPPTYRPGYWGWWYFNRIEYRDEAVVFFSNFLPAGSYQYSYYLETPIPGAYQVRPAVAYEEFFPDVFGRSAGKLFTITR